MADKCCQCAVKTNANDSTVCDCCKMRMHYRCTDLTDDDINFLRRSKSTQITILCKSCKSGLSSVRDLKLNIESLQLSLNQRLSAIETAIKSPVISKDQKEEIIRESVERSLRAANIILANVPESSNDQDVTVANDILECIDPSAIVSPENVTRIGKKVPNHPRLLKLKLKDVDMARMNVRGLRTKTNEFYVSVLETSADIIALSETWLDPKQMRKTLRTLLRLERESNPLVYPVHPYDTATDVTALNNKIRELQSLIDEFDGSTDTVHRKLLSKLAHALGRPNRIKPSTPEERKSSSKIIVTLLNFKTDIETKVKRASADQSLSALEVSLLNVDDDEESDGEESMLVTSTPLHAPVCETTSRSHVVPVHKWNLKFSGEDPRLSLSSFLIRVEELRIARHATEEDLYNSAIDLFEGRALTWYRSIRRQATA
ncbi:hypothetical protein GEV33_008033 [Tenebrio molitor]|uniref:Zinc finger PHD-type domain-containing protein n=1 Tax=Tenebrio molitor TaxID=7067 RepID=A0A8J6HJI8_TENMO|nr:hypothetical protein GEV33_008033 [Tenebrio molitor]